jgi:hypothetical protein
VCDCLHTRGCTVRLGYSLLSAIIVVLNETYHDVEHDINVDDEFDDLATTPATICRRCCCCCFPMSVAATTLPRRLTLLVRNELSILLTMVIVCFVLFGRRAASIESMLRLWLLLGINAELMLTRQQHTDYVRSSW